MPAKAIIEPTERSNSPPIISREAPVAMIINWAVMTVQLMMPSGRNIPVLPAVMPKNRKTRIAPAIAPNSGRASNRRVQDRLPSRSSSL